MTSYAIEINEFWEELHEVSANLLIVLVGASPCHALEVDCEYSYAVSRDRLSAARRGN